MVGLDECKLDGLCVVKVFGRALILFGLIAQDPKLQTTEVVWWLYGTWSAIELVRYVCTCVAYTIHFEIHLFAALKRGRATMRVMWSVSIQRLIQIALLLANVVF